MVPIFRSHDGNGQLLLPLGPRIFPEMTVSDLRIPYPIMRSILKTVAPIISYKVTRAHQFEQNQYAQLAACFILYVQYVIQF